MGGGEAGCCAALAREDANDFIDVPPGPSNAEPASASEPSAPLVPVLVKPLRAAAHTRAGEAPEDAETQVVHMSLLQDLKHRLDKRVLSTELRSVEQSRLAQIRALARASQHPVFVFMTLNTYASYTSNLKHVCLIYAYDLKYVCLYP